MIRNTNLKRHLLNKHKNEPEIEEIKKLNDFQEQNKKIDLIRKRGIYLYNQSVVNEGCEFITKRPTKNPVVMCKTCKIFISKKFLSDMQVSVQVSVP